MERIDTLLRKNTYGEKLQDERWRTFSKSIRQQRGSCEMCRRADVTLQLHHLFYEPSREPWEYSDTEVVVLCRSCHEQIHFHLRQFRKFVFGKMTPQVFQIINGALAVAFDKYKSLEFAHALAEFVSTPSMVERYAKAWERPEPTGAETQEKIRTRTILSEINKNKKRS